MTFKKAVLCRYFKRAHSTKTQLSWPVIFMAGAFITTLTVDNLWLQVGRGIVNALIPMAAASHHYEWTGESAAKDKILPRRGRVITSGGDGIANAKIEASAFNYKESYGKTNSAGQYNFEIFRPGCVGSSYTKDFKVFATFQTKSFHPEAPEISDVTWAWVRDAITCFGAGIWEEVGILRVDGVPRAETVDYIASREQSTLAFNEKFETVLDIYVDTMVFSGVARLVNIAEGGAESLIPIGGVTEYANQGLLNTLSKEDLQKTDVYIFRESNGMMVAKHTGLDYSMMEVKGNNHFAYDFPIPGRFHSGTINPADRSAWQDAQNIAESLRPYKADHLRPGEAIKIIAINRPSGYIGVVNTTAALPVDGLIDIPSDPIILRPPNLKIWAERIYSVEKGLTDGKKRKYTIGFEGSGLTSDTMVSIHTRWFDQNGKPLPEELEGYTGRMAKITAPNSLEGGDMGRFTISPGEHQQVLKFKGDILGTEHFYVHVSGFSAWQSAGIGAASSGPLQYRPKNYVPIKVPVLNESATAQVRKLNAKAKAIYEWPYRPEMQFSVFDLKIKDIAMTTLPDEIGAIGAIQSIYQKEKPVIDKDASMVELFFALLENQNAPLEPLGPGRELVFALGEDEITATYGPNGQLIFNNLEQLAKLAPADYLAMQLYDKNDNENILWEWAFGIEGIQLNTSADEGSDAVDSFIMSSTQQAITAELVGEFKEGDTIVWKVEALKGSMVGDDLPSSQSNSTNKPYAYGKTQQWKTGRFSAVTTVTGTGDGRFENAWQSQPIAAVNAKFFSFKPDMSDELHMPAVYQSGVSSGTKRKDVWRRNPHVAYKVTAVLNKSETSQPFYAKAKMDHTDALRQEYINHLASAADAAGNLVTVPQREDLISVPETGDWVEKGEGLNSYAYDVMVDESLTTLLTQLNATINTNINNTFPVPDHDPVSWPSDAEIVVTSAYRNPERNERVGGASGSRHMMGRALDIAITGVTPEEKEIAYYILWQIFESNRPANVDFYQLEDAPADWIIKSTGSKDTDWVEDNEEFVENGIEDGFLSANHFHLQDNP